MKCIIDVKEHEKIDVFDEKENKEKIFDKFNKAKSQQFLDIRYSIFNNIWALKAGYYIGYRWFETNKSYIHISQKEYNNKQADFLAMFMECLNDEVVSSKMDKSYQIFFDEPLIEIQDKKDEITPFLIIHFLKIVNKIAKKGLKKGYVRVTENLTSKIKGKILVNQTIKHNHFKNRFDKTVCNYQIYTINSLENQILKTALMQCSRYFQYIRDDKFINVLRYNLNTFELVDTKDVFGSDFFKIKHSPFYKEYKQALNLAKMILKKLGFSLQNKLNFSNKIPPYYINMSELFERYVEVQLRKSNITYIDGNKKSYTWQMRPDFLLPDKKIILDAKYKFWYESGKNKQNNENSEFKDDYMQLSLYGRDKKIRDDLEITSDNEEIDLVFIYPDFEVNENIDLKKKKASKSFNKIYKIGIKVPSKE